MGFVPQVPQVPSSVAYELHASNDACELHASNVACELHVCKVACLPPNDYTEGNVSKEVVGSAPDYKNVSVEVSDWPAQINQ